LTLELTKRFGKKKYLYIGERKERHIGSDVEDMARRYAFFSKENSGPDPINLIYFTMCIYM